MKLCKNLVLSLVAVALALLCMIALPQAAHAASESDLTFGLNKTQDGYIVSRCDTSATGELAIPATYNGLPVTAISEDAFSWCTSLTGITIPDSVTTIGDYAFYYCTGLTGIAIPDNVTSIGTWAFHDCDHLTGITIPDNVTSIGDFAFSSCDRLTSITIPDSVTTIGPGAFDECTSLTSVTIGNGVTTIENGAFGCCKSLISITILDSVTSIGHSAFSGCTSLSSVIYCGTQEQWDTITIRDYNEPLTDATLRFHDYKNGTCAICGEGSDAAGDIDGNGIVEQDDAVYLLLNTMFGGEKYPLKGAPADIDSNGTIDKGDVVYLLLHTMFGDKYFPLKKS